MCCRTLRARKPDRVAQSLRQGDGAAGGNGHRSSSRSAPSGSSTLHLAYVGIGLLDGVVDHNVRVWDIAAAHAIALGGGAEIHYLSNHPFPLRQFDPRRAADPLCRGQRGSLRADRGAAGRPDARFPRLIASAAVGGGGAAAYTW